VRVVVLSIVGDLEEFAAVGVCDEDVPAGGVAVGTEDELSAVR
jgi:hypothetical protein